MPRILICSLALLLPLQVLAAERKGSGDRHEQAERGGSSGKKGSGKGGNKPSQPAKPALPSQPAKPAQPSQPARPAQPSQPARPAQPSQPARPAEPSRPAEPRPADNRPGDSRPSDSRPSDSRPSDARPADNGPGDSRPSDARPSDARPADNRPGDARPADSRPDDARPSSEPVRANPRPVDDRAEDRGGREGGQDDRGGRPNVTASPRPVQGPARTAPVVQRVQVGQPASMANAAPQNRRSAAPAPANFRSSSVQAVSRSRGGSNSAPATRVMAQHRAQTARQVAASAAAHRRAAVVRHHHAAHAHHQAWVRHHYSVWRPHRYYVYPRPYPYWYDPWYYGRPVRWYHGVFVYGPPVVHHHYYTDSTPEDVPEQAEAPKRTVDRSHTFAVGIRGGSYLSSYSNGASYGDAGLGLALRYRPVEALGFEAQWTYHDQSWSRGSERVQQPFSLSAELFAMPWSRFNPYVLAGVTYTGRNINDPQGRSGTVETEQALWGPHGGIGLELGVGDRASVNFDLRGIGYVNKPDNDISRPGAVQANMGVNFYF